MRKHEEISNVNSCLNKAIGSELLFVLLGRDESAPVAIRAWAEHRVKSGKNKPDDQLIVEALGCAEQMEIERSRVREQLGKA